MGRRAGVVALCLAIGLMIGCGGGGSSNTTQQLRIVMASSDAPPVDILIDGSQVATALAYGNSTAYLTVKAGQRRIQALTVANSKSIFDQTISVSGSSNQTLLVTGSVSKLQSMLLTDGATNTTITTGQGKVRVVNASLSMGAADVYVVNAGENISGVPPTAPGLAFDKGTAYESAEIGNYQVFMTQPGTTNAYLNTGPLDLTQSQFQTVVALDAVGGGFNYIVLTDQ